MANLIFDWLGARAEPYAAAPTLTFSLRVSETTGAAIHAIALRCQIRIEPAKRRYSAEEAARLADLFGDVSRWADTLKPIQFTTVSTVVTSFTGTTDVDLTVPCTYDLEVAATRYFAGLDNDAVPLLMLFSGTVFSKGPGGISVEPVPWSAECTLRMPVSVWRDLVDRYFPGSGWIRLSRTTLDALGAVKSREAYPTWDATVDALLARKP